MKTLDQPAGFHRGAPFSSFEDLSTDRLAEAVETFNSETDPAERVRLFGSIRELRAKLMQADGSRERIACGGTR